MRPIDKSVGDRDHLATSRHVKMFRCGLFGTDLCEPRRLFIVHIRPLGIADNAW